MERERATNQLPGEFACNPQEGFLKVVIGFCRDIVILNVGLLAVKHNVLRLHFAVFDVHLVPAEHDGDVLANPSEVAVPHRHRLVRDPRRDVEHNDGRLPADIVPVPQSAKLFLSRSVPAIVHDRSQRRIERQRVHLHAQGRYERDKQIQRVYDGVQGC